MNLVMMFNTVERDSKIHTNTGIQLLYLDIFASMISNQVTDEK